MSQMWCVSLDNFFVMCHVLMSETLLEDSNCLFVRLLLHFMLFFCGGKKYWIRRNTRYNVPWEPQLGRGIAHSKKGLTSDSKSIKDNQFEWYWSSQGDNNLSPDQGLRSRVDWCVAYYIRGSQSWSPSYTQYLTRLLSIRMSRAVHFRCPFIAIGDCHDTLHAACANDIPIGRAPVRFKESLIHLLALAPELCHVFASSRSGRTGSRQLMLFSAISQLMSDNSYAQNS